MEEDNVVLEPEVTEPEVTDSDVTEPEVTEPEEMEQDLTDPEEIDSELTDNDSSEPVIIAPDYDMYYNAVYNAVSDAIEARQTVTDNQSIPNTVLEHFKGILMNYKLPVDYVIYVGNPYEFWWGNNLQTGYDYCMAYGDLECNGDFFTGTGKIVTMRTNGQNSISFMNDQQIALQAPYYYSKSNLGDYPGIYQYDYTGLSVLIALVIGGLTWFFKKLLSVKY